MDAIWQTVIVAVLIAVACIYLARAAWQTMARKKSAACGTCSACPANPAGNEPEVVGLGTLQPPAARLTTERNGTPPG